MGECWSKEKELGIIGEKNVETELLRNYRKEYKEQPCFKIYQSLASLILGQAQTTHGLSGGLLISSF